MNGIWGPLTVTTIDPGASAGYCTSADGAFTAIGLAPDSAPAVDELVVEDQYAATHIYRNGRRVRVSRKSQQTLSFRAGQLFERYSAERKYRIGPDAWRRILWPGAVRLTKKVVLARLMPKYGHLVADVPAKSRPDVLEAIGMNVAWCRLTPEQKEAYRAR